METITYNELIAKIRQVKGAKPVTLETITEMELLKTGNTIARQALKHSLVRTFIGADYELAVNNQALRQETFATQQGMQFKASSLPKDRQWFIDGFILQSKSDPNKFYLRTQTTPGMRRKAKTRIIDYRHPETGKFLARKDIAPFIPVKTASKRQATIGLEDKEDQIFVNDYKLTSIKSIRFDGKRYQLAQD